MEERIARIEGFLEQVNERVKGVENEFGIFRDETGREISSLREETGRKLDSLREETNGRIDSLREEMVRNVSLLRQQVESNFRWTVGILLSTIIPMWVTIILAILLRG